MRTLLMMCLMVLCAGPGLAAKSDLLVYSGAGLMKPMEAFRTSFEDERGVSIDVHYAGSGEIFGMLSMGKCCDVFIPGAEKYTMDALKKGWIKEDSIHKIVRHIPVIAVPRGNPGNIRSLEDLTREDVDVALGDTKACAIGRVARKLLQKNGLFEQVQARTTVQGPTVNQLLIYVAMDRVDAAIICEDLVAWAEGRNKVEILRIQEDKNLIKTIPTAVTTCGANPGLAREFNAYIASPQGLKTWEKWGFEPCAQ